MTVFTSSVGEITTTTQIMSLGRKDLVQLYNELTGKSTKSFRTTTVGIVRTTEAFQRWVECQPTQAVETPSPTRVPVRKKSGPRGITFPLPARADRKLPRANSRVEAVMEALALGCDYEGVCNYVTNKRTTPLTVGMLTGVLRHISSVLGYGVTRDPDHGYLNLVDEEGVEIDVAE